MRRKNKKYDVSEKVGEREGETRHRGWGRGRRGMGDMTSRKEKDTRDYR